MDQAASIPTGTEIALSTKKLPSSTTGVRQHPRWQAEQRRAEEDRKLRLKEIEILPQQRQQRLQGTSCISATDWRLREDEL
jgi:hypothetical protein